MTAGDMAAAEVVQLFVAPSPALLQAAPSNNLPTKALKGFARVMVQPGQHQVVQLALSSKDFLFASSGITPFCMSSTLISNAQPMVAFAMCE